MARIIVFLAIVALLVAAGAFIVHTAKVGMQKVESRVIQATTQMEQ